MSRQSTTIPEKEKPKRKKLIHYINGLNANDGIHPGIRSKCQICRHKK